MDLSLHTIAQVLGITTPHPDLLVTGYSIDSRTLHPRDLFFAIRGERLDGHDFVLPTLSAGASAAIVDALRLGDFPESVQPRLLGVSDTVKALQKLAAEVRGRWGGPVVAVTGSTGKTTTRHMTASLLSTRFRVLESERNLNNHLGLPLSLLRLKPDTEVGVFELGMSAPDEIRLLAEIAAPDVGVVTNVSAVHLEFFPDVEAIARAKYELIETLGPEAWAVLNADDSRVSQFGQKMIDRVLYFGLSPQAHFQAQNLEQNSDGGFLFSLAAKSFQNISSGTGRSRKFAAMDCASGRASDLRFHLSLPGRHNVLNVLSALAVCFVFGIAPDCLQDAVAALRPASMRGEVIHLPNGATILNDCYNSSPEALEAMLVTAASLPARRRIAVLGGMMELGESSGALHQRAGSRVAELGFDGLFTVGEEARVFAVGARGGGLPESAIFDFDTPEQAGDRLRDILGEGDVVLLKGSRAVHLEKIWDQLSKLSRF